MISVPVQRIRKTGYPHPDAHIPTPEMCFLDSRNVFFDSRNVFFGKAGDPHVQAENGGFSSRARTRQMYNDRLTYITTFNVLLISLYPENARPGTRKEGSCRPGCGYPMQQPRLPQGGRLPSLRIHCQTKISHRFVRTVPKDRTIIRIWEPCPAYRCGYVLRQAEQIMERQQPG